MGMQLGDKGGAVSQINVTPFVDVVLVLLIIFMVLTPLMLREIGVTIPRKADEEVTADVAAQQLVLHLTDKGEILLAGQPVQMMQLADRVRSLLSKRQDKLMFVRVDDKVLYGTAVQAMDICRGAGVRTLGMTTKK